MRERAKIFCMVGFISFLLAFLLPNHSLAQESAEDIIIGKSIKIKSELLNEERTLSVFLPRGYERSQEKYPVLYLLDGAVHFKHVAGLIDFFSSRGLWPQMIVIALHNTVRDRDLTPSKAEGRPNSGGADNFLKFLREELILYVDENYRTRPFRILAGHSLAGLFTVYALLRLPDLFNAYIASSPWLIFDDEFLVKKAEVFLKEPPAFKEILFISVANEPNLLPSIRSFTQILENNATKNLDWKYTYMENDDHVTVPHRSFFYGLEALFADWTITEDVADKGAEAIKEHYQMLSEKFGYKIEIPFNSLYVVGMKLMQQKKIKQSIQVFKLNAELYPRIWIVYSCLGEAYMKNGEKELAIENYEKALELNPKFSKAKEMLKKLKQKR